MCVQRLEQALEKAEVDLDELADRKAVVLEHLRSVQAELGYTQARVTTTAKAAEGEAHLRALHQREAARLAADVQVRCSHVLVCVRWAAGSNALQTRSWGSVAAPVHAVQTMKSSPHVDIEQMVPCNLRYNLTSADIGLHHADAAEGARRPGGAAGQPAKPDLPPERED